MGFFKCQKCGVEVPDFDVAHACVGDGTGTPKFLEMWQKPVMIHGYRLVRTCNACPEQYDVYAGGEMVAYFRLRHGTFRVDVPDCGGETIYTANPQGDGIFTNEERVKYLTEAVLAVQEYYINRMWNKEDDY